MALACLWYSWPRMLKEAPCTVVPSYGCTVVQLYGHMVIRSYGHIVVQSYGRMVGWAYGHTTKFFWLDGLLLFCIIMGLRSASSAINHIFSCEWIRNLKLTKWSSQEIEIEKEAQKKSQAWTGFKLSCDRHKLNPYQSLEKASFPITILIAV